jgi:hypothetical protein
LRFTLSKRGFSDVVVRRFVSEQKMKMSAVYTSSISVGKENGVGTNKEFKLFNLSDFLSLVKEFNYFLS